MKIKNRFVKFLMILSLLPGAYLPSWAEAAGGSCTQKIVAKCKSNGQQAGQTDVAPSGAMYGDAVAGSTATLGASAKLGAAAGQCRDSAKQCDQCPEAEREQCKQAVNGAAGTMDQQSASMGDAGGAMGAIAGMMAGLLPMLMQKKQEEKKDNDSALRPDGSIDCSKNDAYQFSQCNEMLSASCKNAMSDPRCVNFAARYCTASEGSGSQYCNIVAAYNFCSPGGRDTCPSCLMLQKQASEACQQDPASCLGQNSPAELEKSRPACPQDPVFAAMPSGSYGAPVTAPAGSTPIPGGAVVTNNPNLPPVILPKSVQGGGRDSYANNPTGAGAGAAVAASGANANGRMAVNSIRPGGSARDMASAGPVSDVIGPFGPSLFATSSQVIRSHCAAGKFLNCP